MNKFDKFDEIFLSANQYADRGDFKEAIKLYSTIALHKPHMDDLLLRMGLAFFNLEEYKKSISSLNLFLKYQPDALFAHQVLGRAYLNTKNFNSALIEFNKEINLNPDYDESFSDKAYALIELNRFEEAYDAALKANELNPSNPNSYDCMAIALGQMGQYSEALLLALKAVEIDKKNPDFYRTVGDIYLHAEENKKALKHYDQALKINPNHLIVLFHKSLALLKTYNFTEGWKLYEYRHLFSENKRQDLFQDFSIQKSKEFKRLLIAREQGLGDFIMFSSLLADLNHDEKDIVVETDERILPLMKRSFEKIEFIKNLNHIEKSSSDIYTGICSLGGYLRGTKLSFKNQKNSFLISNKDKKKEFENFFKEIKDNPKQKICGLSWRSSNKTIGNLKSIDLRELKPLLELTEIKFVNLQYEYSKHDIEEIRRIGLDIINFPEINIYDDIESLCSIIDACDFVVTISNINAHLAGALGKKTYLLSAKGKAKHFYWCHKQDSSLWYPTLKIFEQDNLGDWSSPINKVIETLSCKNDE